ncbi:MAG: DUF433 domain-containing protein [Chromatiaceae bacterium]
MTTNPGQCGGRRCIRGMRIRVPDIPEMLAEGVSADEMLSDFPDLEAEDKIRISRFRQYAVRARGTLDFPSMP